MRNVEHNGLFLWHNWCTSEMPESILGGKKKKRNRLISKSSPLLLKQKVEGPTLGYRTHAISVILFQYTAHCMHAWPFFFVQDML